MRIFPAWMAVAILFTSSMASAQTVRVAVLGQGNHANTMAGMLNDQNFADIQATGLGLNDITQASQLSDYDAVLAASDGGFSNGAGLGDALADYVDSGKGVVMAVFMMQTSIDIQGRWRTGGYHIIPAHRNDQYSASTLGTIHAPNHPIVAGVRTMSVTTYRTGTTPLVDGAQAILSYADGQPLAAIRENKNGRIAWCGFYPPPTFNSHSGDSIRMLVNELVWVAQRSNRNPTVDAGPDVAVNEGSTVSLTAIGIDLDGDPLTYAWDLDGDGQYDDATGSSVEFNGTDGPSTVTVGVQVSDGNGGQASDTATVQIHNVAPVVSVAALSGSESSPIQFTARVTDPAGDLDTLTYAWVFGDGNTSSEVAPSHTYADDGTYTAQLTVSDEDGGTTTREFPVTVADVLPALSALIGGTNLNEGTTSTYRTTLTKANLDTVRWTIVWGDGTPNTIGSAGRGVTSAALSEAHQFLDDGRFVVIVRATDDDGNRVERQRTVNVANVDPSIDAIDVAPETGPEGSTFVFTPTISDPGADTHTYRWDFDDEGTSNEARPSHVFAQDGSYEVTLTVTDDDDGVTSRTVTVVVTNAAPRITGFLVPETAEEGSEITVSATAADPGGDPLTYTWNFGDGDTATGALATHTFRDDGAYRVTVIVTDTGLLTDVRTAVVQVSNVAPALSDVSIPSEGLEGTEVAFSAVGTDPGADTLTWLWTFGDDATSTDRQTAHTYADDGVYFVQVTVTDDDGASTTVTGQIVIANVAPTITSITGDFSGEEGGTFSYVAAATDPGADTLTYGWDFGDGSDPDVGLGRTDITHRYLGDGTYTLTLTVSDEDGGTTRATRTVNVGGSAPSIQSLTGDTEGDEGSALSYAAVATDPGNDTLTYSWDFGDGTELEGEGLRAVTHRYLDDGQYTVNLRVSDGDGSATATLGVTVANVAPTITRATVPESTTEGAGVPLSAAATDPAGTNDPLTFTWNFGDGSDPGTGDQVSHVYRNEGTFTVTLTVEDDDGGRTQVERTITVGNVAPTITSFEAPETLNEASTGDFRAAASDPGADTLVFRWSFGDGTDPVSGPAVAHAFADDGTYLVILTVSDGTDAVTRNHTVSVANVAPVILALTGDTEGNEADDFSFTATVTDVAGDADPIGYTWDFGDGSNPVQGIGLSAVTHTYGDAGEYTLRLRVDDGDGGVTNRSLIVTVGNAAPEIDSLSGDEAGDEGSTFSYSASASDPGGDTLNFIWEFGDGSETVQGVGLDAVQHVYEDNGTFTLTLSVSDGTDITRRSLEVRVSNVAPSIQDVELEDEIAEGVEVSFRAIATDPAGDADPLRYAWTFGDGEAAEGAVVRHAYPDNGPFTLTLTVSDDDGGQDETEVSVTVINVAPSIDTFIVPAEVAEGSVLQVRASASDVPSDTLTYTWRFEDGPQVSGVGLTEATHTYPDDGTFTVTLEVADEDGGQSEQTATVRVQNAKPIIVSLTGDFAGEEGQTLNFTAEASDPGDDVLTYAWNFGDDREFTEGVDLREISHAYELQGQYTLTLVVSDDDGEFASVTRTVNINVAAPTLGDVQIPDSGQEGLSVAFSATATDPTDQTLVYAWDFGDGSEIASGVDLTSVEHTYADDDSYLVEITVTDPDDLSAAAVQRIDIANVAPTIDSLDVPSFSEGAPATTTAAASDPAGDADPLTWTWNFGDGTPAESGVDLVSVEHTYAASGTYTLRVTVDDGDGGVVEDTREVVVANVSAVIESLDGPATANEADEVEYTVEATDPGGDALSYSWQLGVAEPIDTGNAPSVLVRFPDDGAYVLTVTVTDEEGAQTTATHDIDVANVAPEIESLDGQEEANEGDAASFTASATDVAGPADPLSYTWDFGDGSDIVSGLDLTAATHAYADNGEYTVTLTVDDGDGDEDAQQIQILVINVAPVIVSQPPTVAVVNRELRYNVVVEDPGADTLSFTLVEGPEGMAFDDDDDLVWTLPVQLLGDGPFPVTIRVTDDDGGLDEQTWEIATDFVDSDEDGVPDECEVLYGLNPNDPNDGDLDNDEDGINNRDECLEGTDPTTFNGPSAPEILSPVQDERVETLTPELVVENATDPDNHDLTYTFELYTNADLTDLVVAAADLGEGDTITAFAVEEDLQENAWYYWRAQAADPFVSGAWSEVGAFLVDAANEPPSVPNPVSPWGSSDTTTPALVVDASEDPEGDAITYLFEIRAASDDEIVASGASDETMWTTDTELDEDTSYFWRAAAQDDLGAMSEWSQAVPMHVNVDNTLPEAPVIVAPEENEVVDATPVTVAWAPAVDADSDPLFYEIQVATDEGFSEVIFEMTDLVAPDAGRIEVEVDDLVEDSTHFARVRAHDPYGAGAYGSVGFVVNTENTTPAAPVLVSPIDGETVDIGVTPDLVDILLVFENSEDFDGDEVTYTVRVFGDAELGEEKFAQDSIAADLSGTTTVKWSTDQAGTYFWTAEAIDPEGLSAVGGPEEFVVAFGENQPPTAPTPVSPIADATVDPDSFVLIVDNGSDPERGALTYAFEIHLDEETSDPIWEMSGVAEGEDGQTSIAVTDLDTMGATKFYWVATVSDGIHDPVQSIVASFTLPVATVTSAEDSGCDCTTPTAPARAPTGAVLIVILALLGVATLRR